MKKVTTIIGAVCMMGLLTFVSTSCKKNENKGDMTIQIAIPQAEEEVIDGQRAYLDPAGKFYWSKRDQVRVYNLATEANADESTTSIFHKVGGTNADELAYFQGPTVGPKKPLAYRLFYPYNMVDGTDKQIEDRLHAGNRQTFKVEKKQHYSYFETEDHMTSLIDPAAMPMATNVENLNGPATLRHIFGFLKFGIGAMPGENIIVDSIKLKDNDQHLTGKVTLNIGEVNIDDLNGVWTDFMDVYHGYTPGFVLGPLRTLYTNLGWVNEPTGYEITLDCVYDHDGGMNGVQLVNTGGYTWFTFVVRPGACWNGFNLVMYVHNEDTGATKEVNIARWAGEDPGTPGMDQPDDYTTPNYQWAMLPRKIKTFLYQNPVKWADFD